MYGRCLLCPLYLLLPRLNAILIFFSFLSFFLSFFLNNSISSSICKLPIGSEIYNCTFKNTNKVSIIIIMINSTQPFFGFCLFFTINFIIYSPLSPYYCLALLFSRLIVAFIWNIVNRGAEWLWNPSESFLCFCTPDGAQRLIAFLIFRSYWPIKTSH